MSPTSSGKIILLNGASSAGKTTIARALQDEIEEPFWHFSIDHLQDAGVLPLQRIQSGEFNWRELRTSFFDGFYRALPVFARSGNNLIVEHIVETPEWMALLVRLLEPFDVFFVGVHCPLKELNRRETARGDRKAGEAQRDYYSVHLHADYDFEIDSTLSLDRNIYDLLLAWRARTRPSAFDRLLSVVQ